MLDKIKELFEDVLERDSGTVKPGDMFREFEEWDSLAYLSVIAKIDEDYGIVIPREEFQNLRTVKDLADYLERNS